MTLHQRGTHSSTWHRCRLPRQISTSKPLAGRRAREGCASRGGAAVFDGNKAVGDQIAVGSSLLSLGDVGCTTPLPDGSCVLTHPVINESPAHDQGNCTVSGATADARGFARPWDDPAVANSGATPVRTSRAI